MKEILLNVTNDNGIVTFHYYSLPPSTFLYHGEPERTHRDCRELLGKFSGATGKVLGSL
jgi:hypothetical protein